MLRRTWTETAPFDAVALVERVSEVRCFQQPLSLGSAAYRTQSVGAKHCDTYALFGEPRAALENINESVTSRRNTVDHHDSTFRPIIAATESAAWAKAEGILAGVLAATQGRHREPEAETARRLVRLAQRGDVHDERLWTPIAGAADGSGNTTALVGTPDQVADALVKYYALGVSGVLLRGFDPVADAEDYGRELIPLIRKKVAAADANATPVPTGSVAG